MPLFGLFCFVFFLSIAIIHKCTYNLVGSIYKVYPNPFDCCADAGKCVCDRWPCHTQSPLTWGDLCCPRGTKLAYSPLFVCQIFFMLLLIQTSNPKILHVTTHSNFGSSYHCHMTTNFSIFHVIFLILVCSMQWLRFRLHRGSLAKSYF